MFLTIKRFLLLAAFHYHPPIVLICLKYCKGYKSCITHQQLDELTTDQRVPDKVEINSHVLFLNPQFEGIWCDP